MEESPIIEKGLDSRVLQPEASEAVLVHLGSNYALYRVTIEGKRFLLKTPATDNARLRQVLRREYERGVRIDHPNIAQAVFFGEVIPGEEGLLMEDVEGRSLTEFLAENPSRKVRGKVLRQLLDAVEHIHRLGLIHNDLNPDNIYITYNGNNLKLIDFGLSATDLDSLSQISGYTPAYASPELQGERRGDARSDIYSIGKLIEDLYDRRRRRIARKSSEPLPGDRYQSVEEIRKGLGLRDRLWWVAGGVAAMALICIGAILVFGAGREGDDKTGNGTAANTLQNGIPGSQQMELESLQKAYVELSDSLRRLNATYLELRDSVDRAKGSEERHKKAVEERIEDFNKEMDTRMQKALQSLRKYRTASEAASFLSMFSDDMENFYRGYPKTVDDEDITLQIHSAYQEAMSHTEEFVKIISTLP